MAGAAEQSRRLIDASLITRMEAGQGYETAQQTIELVSPDQALAWLETVNTKNRPVLSRRVGAYASDMKAGRWRFNGEPIQFDIYGNLLNGQHRLWAVVESGVPCRFAIVRGLPPDAQNTMDMGSRRTAGQIGYLNGIPNSNQAAAIVRLILVYDKYDKHFGKGGSGRTPTTTEVSAYSIEHYHAIEPALRVSNKCTKPLQAATVAGFCFFVFSRVDPGAAETFFEKLIKGGCANTDPLFHLRERLLQHTASKYVVPRDQVIALFFKCWNYHRAGRPMRHLANRTDEELQVIE